MEGDFGTSSLITFDLAFVVAWHGAVAVLRLVRRARRVRPLHVGAVLWGLQWRLTYWVCARNFHAVPVQRAKLTGEKKWSVPSLARTL